MPTLDACHVLIVETDQLTHVLLDVYLAAEAGYEGFATGKSGGIVECRWTGTDKQRSASVSMMPGQVLAPSSDNEQSVCPVEQ